MNEEELQVSAFVCFSLLSSSFTPFSFSLFSCSTVSKLPSLAEFSPTAVVWFFSAVVKPSEVPEYIEGSQIFYHSSNKKIMMADVDKDQFVNDDVPALSPDVLMAAVVRLLPFTDALVPKLRVKFFAIAKLLNLMTYISLFRKLYISTCFHKIIISKKNQQNILMLLKTCCQLCCFVFHQRLILWASDPRKSSANSKKL